MGIVRFDERAEAYYEERPIYCGKNIIGWKKHLVMSKDIFLECYNRWILEGEKNGMVHEEQHDLP